MMEYREQIANQLVNDNEFMDGFLKLTGGIVGDKNAVKQLIRYVVQAVYLQLDIEEKTQDDDWYKDFSFMQADDIRKAVLLDTNYFDNSVMPNSVILLRKNFIIFPNDSKQLIVNQLRNEDEYTGEILRAFHSDIPNTSDREWRRAVITAGLGCNSVTIRDNTMILTEEWLDDVIDIVRSHNEPADWLAKYQKDILEYHVGQ